MFFLVLFVISLNVRIDINYTNIQDENQLIIIFLHYFIINIALKIVL